MTEKGQGYKYCDVSECCVTLTCPILFILFFTSTLKYIYQSLSWLLHYVADVATLADRADNIQCAGTPDGE